MIPLDTLERIVIDQKREMEALLATEENEIRRELRARISLDLPHAIVLTGIRRCGKSTLLRQLMRQKPGAAYFNFEDNRLAGFTPDDFEKLRLTLDRAYAEPSHYFFDEIQSAGKWELFIRLLLDHQKKVAVTGSNAALLGRELGTKLTGRHLQYELFPFSYREMIQYTGQPPGPQSWEDYMLRGGFPEYLAHGRTELLQRLLIDVLMRDIAARHQLRETRTLQELAIYLLNQVGTPFSFNALARTFELGSANTARAFVAYLEDTYLFFSMPKYDVSLKRQAYNPKKIYAVDNGLCAVHATVTGGNEGRRLENAVFGHLRRQGKKTYYFREKHECDFIAKDQRGGLEAIQVCRELHADNQKREIFGLQEAMDSLKLKRGLIVTKNQNDQIKVDSKTIEVVPAWNWMQSDPFGKTP